MNPTKFLIIALIVLSAVSTIESASVHKCLGPNCRRLAVKEIYCVTYKCRRLVQKKKATAPKEKVVLNQSPPSGDTPPLPSAKAQAAKNKADSKKPSTPAAILKKKTDDAKKSVADAKKAESNAQNTLKKANSIIKSSKSKIEKIKQDLKKAKHSDSKNKDAKIQKISAQLSKEHAIQAQALRTRSQAESAADEAKVSIATAKSRVPPKKGQEPTQPNPGPPKNTGDRVFYLEGEGKRIKIPDDLLEMKPKLRVRACIKSWCFSTGENEQIKKKVGISSIGCVTICRWKYGNPLAWQGKTAGEVPAEYPRWVAFLKANGLKGDKTDENAAAKAAAKAAAPKTAAKAAAPKTAAPKTAAPKTAAPKTAAPKTAAPKTAAPKTAAPKTAAPKTAAPKTAA